MKRFAVLALCLAGLVAATPAFAAEINTSQLSENGWFSDDTRADGTGTETAGNNLVSPTLTDDPEATASGNAAHDAEILNQILFGPAPGTVPSGTHLAAAHLRIGASTSGKSQISHRKDDASGHGPGSVFGPGFSLVYSWMGDGTATVTASVKFGIKTAEFGSTGVSSRTGENAWDKVLIYEPGNLNGGTSDGLWHTETVDFTTGQWWFHDRTAGAGTIGTPLTLSDMSTSATVFSGSKTIQDVYDLVTAPGAIITSVQVGIGSGNAGGSVYVNQIETNAYRAGDVTTFGAFPVQNITQSTEHPTIQDGVDNANPGDVLQVAAGVFEEQLDIGINIEINGAGAGATIVRSPVSLTGNFVTGSNTNYPVVHVHDATSIVLRDLTVDGAGRGNGNSRFIGVGGLDVGGGLYDCEVTGIRETPFNGNQHGVGIYVYNTSPSPRSWAVVGCDVSDFQKNGMSLYAELPATLDVNVSGNTVTGHGATDITAQNGIQTHGDGMTGAVDGNVVQGIAYDNTLNPIKYVATSLLDFYSPVDFTNNQVSQGHLGVYKIDGSGSISGNTIDIEKVGVYAFGIIGTDPPRAVPAPFESGVAKRPATGPAKALLAVTMNDNVVTFTGPDNTATYGIEADAGWGPNDIAVSASGNEVTGFEVGFEWYECTSGCDTGVFTSIETHDNSIYGNTIGMRSNVTTVTAQASCNWWGDITGPGATLNPGLGNPVDGDIVFSPWLDAPMGACNQYGDNIAANPTGQINPCTPCVTVPVDFDRTDTTGVRGVSATLQLSPELELCGSQIVQAVGAGAFFDGFGNTVMQVLDNGGGNYTVDIAILGTPCGAVSSGTLFTVDVAKAASVVADATGTITVQSVTVRDCNNVPLPGFAGPVGSIDIDLTAPTAIADLDATQRKVGNDSDGDTIIDLSWTAPTEPDAATISIYRKGFGFYPEYDDLGGAAPAAPADPGTALGAGWVLAGTVAATATSFPDEPGSRDFWYYVAFVDDGCNVSAVSNRTSGTLSYHLGDVRLPPGDNIVNGLDISALGFAYGTIDGDLNYDAELDVGPTTDFFVDARPTTDNKIQFEDLLLFAINHGQVSKDLPSLVPAAVNEAQLVVGDLPLVGESFEVPLRLSADGRLLGLSAEVRWDERRVQYLGWTPGEMMDSQGGTAPVFSPRPGVFDTAVFGDRSSGIAGEGTLAVLRFRVLETGDPGLAFASVDGRDMANQKLRVDGTVTQGAPSGTPNALVSELLPCKPNPFNPRTEVSFRLAQAGDATVSVYSLSGRLVKVLVQEAMQAGDHVIEWDGTDAAGRSVASGTYVVRLRAAGVEQTRNAVLLK